MTIKNQQVKLLMKNLNTKGKVVAAAKAGMDIKTARKYMRSKLLPSEIKVGHSWRTRDDVFEGVWQEVEELLWNAPMLQAKTVFDYLQNKYSGRFAEGQLRTLQRRFRDWRASEGESREV